MNDSENVFVRLFAIINPYSNGPHEVAGILIIERTGDRCGKTLRRNDCGTFLCFTSVSCSFDCPPLLYYLEVIVMTASQTGSASSTLPNNNDGHGHAVRGSITEQRQLAIPYCRRPAKFEG